MFGSKKLNWKKIPVLTKSTPGFIVNHVRFMLKALGHCKNKLPAARLCLKAMRRFCDGALWTLIGQDVNFSVTQSVYQESSRATVQASFKKN